MWSAAAAGMAAVGIRRDVVLPPSRMVGGRATVLSHRSIVLRPRRPFRIRILHPLPLRRRPVRSNRHLKLSVTVRSVAFAMTRTLSFISRCLILS